VKYKDECSRPYLVPRKGRISTSIANPHSFRSLHMLFNSNKRMGILIKDDLYDVKSMPKANILVEFLKDCRPKWSEW